MSAVRNRDEGRNSREIRFWLPVCLATALLMALLTGCVSDNTVTVAGDDLGQSPVITPNAAPTMAEMQQVLHDELTRLGKTTMAAGEYSAPSGDMNIPFDLHALLIDPDGDGGLDPQGVQLRWTERLIGDYNMDGLVNASDLTPLGQYYGEMVEYRDPANTGGVTYWPVDYNLYKPTGGHPNWRLARIDGNGDGLINMQDITAIGQHWQEQLSGYRLAIQRFGAGSFAAVMDPRNESQVLEIPFGWSPVLDGIEYYEQFVNEYRINLPIDASVGETIRIEAVNAAGVGSDPIEVVCQREFPWWISYQPLGGSYPDNMWPGDWFRSQGEVLGVQAYLWEGVPGDLDGTGAVDHYDNAPVRRYINTWIEDYTGDERELYTCADQNGDGIVSACDITSIGTNWGSRADGYAFGYYDELVMNPDFPENPFVYQRPFEFDLQHAPELVELHLPATTIEEELYIYSIACGEPDASYGIAGIINMRNITELSAPFDSADPVVAALSGPYKERVGRAINLGSAYSFSNAGEITTYEWDLDDDGTYETTGPEKTVTPDTPGDYTYRLRVSDNEGNTAEVELTVTVTN